MNRSCCQYKAIMDNNRIPAPYKTVYEYDCKDTVAKAIEINETPIRTMSCWTIWPIIFMPVKTKLVEYVEGEHPHPQSNPTPPSTPAHRVISEISDCVVRFSKITLACVYKAHAYRELNFMNNFELHLLTSLGIWLHRACASIYIGCIKFSWQNVTPHCAPSARD